MRVAAIGLLSLALGCSASASPQPAVAFTDALTAARTSVTISPRGIGGDGAPVLRDAIRAAPFIGIGEDHGTQEIPAFMAAICREMGSTLGALALEVGPTVVEQLEPVLRSPDRKQRMAEWSQRYPTSVAFLDIEADNAAAADCLTFAPAARLIGLDQEFIGAAGMVLDAILVTKLTRDARRIVEQARTTERVAEAKARASGDPSPLMMLSATPQQIEVLGAAITKGGDERARILFARLAESVAIYRLANAGKPEGNAVRAKLMKTTLRSRMPVKGKVLARLGAVHLYKGVNPLGQLDLGNWIAETLDGEGQPSSLHILVAGAKGAQAAFGGYARPFRSEPYDAAASAGARWLAPALAAQKPDTATLFDLRQLRHRRLDGVTPEWRRAIDGYDMLVIIPNVTASPSVAG